jgi:LEA14-like dessication related protein
MDTKKKTIIIVGICAVLVAISVFAYGYIKQQIDKALDYCTKLTKLTIDHVSLQKITLTVYLKIRNRSDLDIKIKNQSYVITANGYAVANLDEKDEVTIKGRAIYEIPITLDIIPSEVLKGVLTNLEYLTSYKENIKIGIKGTFNGGSGFIPVSYKVEEEYTIAELLKDETAEDCWKDSDKVEKKD